MCRSYSCVEGSFTCGSYSHVEVAFICGRYSCVEGVFMGGSYVWKGHSCVAVIHMWKDIYV